MTVMITQRENDTRKSRYRPPAQAEERGSGWRFVALFVLLGMLVAPQRARAEPAPPDVRFGIVETFVNPEAASEAGTATLSSWVGDVIQPGGPADWKPANVPDPQWRAS
jgi:hypothetical protein